MHEAEFFSFSERKTKQTTSPTPLFGSLSRKERRAHQTLAIHRTDAARRMQSGTRLEKARTSTPWGPIERGGRHCLARLRPSAFPFLVIPGGNSVSPPAEQCDQCSVEEDVYQ